MTKAFLDKQGVTYSSIDVGTDAVAAQKMIALSGQRRVPVITVDDEIIVGFDSQRLNELFGTHVSAETYDVIIVGAGPAGSDRPGVLCTQTLKNPHRVRYDRRSGAGVMGNRKLHGLPDDYPVKT